MSLNHDYLQSLMLNHRNFLSHTYPTPTPKRIILIPHPPILYHQDIMKPRMEGYCEEIINFLLDATFVIDLDGKVIAWNRAMEDVTGVTASDILGKGDYAYALPFYNERKPMLANLILLPDEEVAKRYNHIIRDGDTLVVDTFLPLSGRESRFVWAKASPLYDLNGTITGSIETIRDITDQRKMEEILARS